MEESIACGACGAENPPRARFCNQCGAALQAAGNYTPRHLQAMLSQPATIVGERKRVTVLFADIKGSTRLADQAGVELWHEVLDRFLSTLSACVHRYQGTVNQYTGDGIMALFGAPQALEEHALHAAHAALEMQREVRRYADELRLQHGLNLSMRVGLNSGEVVVGRIGDGLRDDYTAQGPTVHLAARVEQLCEPGRVYVSAETAGLLQGYCRLRGLGAAALPGFETPQQLFELEGLAGARGRLERSLARATAPLVGRGAELEALRSAMARVRAGDGQAIAVVGAAGIGKSRLCHEFLRECEAAGLRVHRASAAPYTRRIPLLPIRQLLRSKLGLDADTAPDEARRWIAGALLLENPDHAQWLPYLFDFLGIAEQGATAVLDADGATQARMMAQLADYLPCDPEPLVLLLEDLHFLDGASEAFLPALIRSVRHRKCLLLLNYRPEYVSEPIVAGIDEAIPVGALGADDIRALAQHLLGADASLNGIADTLVRRASGSPFYVEEAIQALAGGGWLEGAPQGYRLVRSIDQWPLPESVQQLLAARIDRLVDAQRQTLQVAAVIGEQFDRALLSEVMEASEPVIGLQLEQLEELGFVFEREEERWDFCHPLMQDVALRGQLESRRRDVHARVAALLEARAAASAAPGELALQIADHWSDADHHERAGHWSLQAAQWAVHHDAGLALEQCRRAIAHLDRCAGTAAIRSLGIRARAALIRLAQFAAVDDQEVERAYQEARDWAQADGDVSDRAELMISYGSEMLHRGQVAVAADLHRQAADLCLTQRRPELINRFRLPLMLSFNAAGQLRMVLDILDRAGGDWRTRPVDEENYLSRGFYGLMLAWMGSLEQAAVHLQDAIRYAERVQRPASWMYANQVDLALMNGAFAPALAAAYRGLERASGNGSPFFRAVALRALGLALSLNGQHQEALAALDEAAPLVVAGAAAHQFEANWMATRALALLNAGDVDAAERMAVDAIDRAQAAGSRIWEIVAQLVWLRLPVTVRRQAAQMEHRQRVIALVAESGAKGFGPWLDLAEAHWAPDPAIRDAARARAQGGFAAIGATAYARSAGVDAEAASSDAEQ